MQRVLVVDDNADMADGIASNLRLEGYDVRTAEDGATGLALAQQWPADLLVLDLMLPQLSGYEVLRALRQAGRRVPVIILSARGDEADKILGFRLDADQYVTKPFGILELIERVRALLRRAGATTEERLIRVGTLVIDPACHTVTHNGEQCVLTPKSFTLLLALVRRNGAVASRADLLKEVWGYGEFVMSRTVDSHISELRHAIEDDPARPRHILTVWSIGYRFAT